MNADERMQTSVTVSEFSLTSCQLRTYNGSLLIAIRCIYVHVPAKLIDNMMQNYKRC